MQLESVYSFLPPDGPGDGTQLVSLDGKLLYALSHLAGSFR